MQTFRLKARAVERGKVWQTIADNLNSHATLRFLVTKKSVREHLKLLLDKYRARMQKERRDSEVEVEQTELDQALEEINEKWEAVEEQDILLLNNRKKTEEDRAMGEEVQKKACEKLGETMKRKGEGEGSSEPKKRSRKGGNDTIEFLREKANIDMAMKKEEQKARREEHERQTRLYELALANQQQQQSNQLMSLMFGLMLKIAKIRRLILFEIKAFKKHTLLFNSNCLFLLFYTYIYDPCHVLKLRQLVKFETLDSILGWKSLCVLCLLHVW